MKRRPSFLTLLAIAGPASLLVACSSSGSPDGSAKPRDSDPVESANDAGTGGAGEDVAPLPAGAAPSAPCRQAADCDDALACNGSEQCVAGACTPGEPQVCEHPQICTEENGGSCVYQDRSPWVVYSADDETPALIEQYAVKRDLVGEMVPIKISQGVTPDSRIYHPTWAPDGRLLSFVVRDEATTRTRIQLVYFDDGAPRHMGDIDGESIQWSTSGRSFVVNGPDEWSIYDYAGEGKSQRLFTRTAAVDSYGWWAKSEDFVFSTKNATSGLRSIERAFHDASGWRTVVLADNLDLASFDLAPTLAELVYTLHKPDGTSGPVYALQWTSGGGPRLLADDGYVSWSPDGSQYLLLRPSSTNAVQAFWGTGSVHDDSPVRVAKSLVLNWARFTADSTQLLISEAIYDGRQDVRLLDPLKSTEYPSDHVTRMGKEDSTYSPPSSSELLVTTSREELGDSATLRVRNLRSRTQSDLDTILPDEEFRRVSISSQGTFVVYQKGKDPDYQTAYVDLRYRENWGYRPVRVGGDDGRVNVFRFDAAGAGLYYVYERANGARECYFLDLSHQVPRDPVKVSREGRVESCLPQP